jgi:AraC-like DNA-binding protein
MTASTDFASAAMIRLIQLSLRQQGLVMPRLESSSKAPVGARVSLSSKRVLVSRLHQTFGSTALLRIGEAIHDAPDEPALVALAMARDPIDLIGRWQRLERFVHSRHRVVIELASDTEVQLQHRSLDITQAPHPGEDLLIFGLLVALLKAMGTAHLKARFASEPAPRWFGGAWQHAAPPPTDTSRWHIAWMPDAVSDGLRPARASASAGSGSSQTAATAAEFLSADPGRGWSLAALAQEMATSPRSLQRQLQAERVSFAALRSQVRSTQAARYLVTTSQSAAQIGYACGYTDQAHFNREFKRHTAFTPLAYRQHFAA